MQVRRSTVVTFLGVCLVSAATAWAAPGALAGSGQVSDTLQTYPTVRPNVGHRHSTFELTFTLVQAPGRTGLVETDYRAVVSPPTHAPRSCSPAQPAPVFSGSQGSVTNIALRPPAQGWCEGRYGVTVFLERAPVCGPPIARPAFIPCPLYRGAVPTFRVSDLNTGETHFTVR